MYYIDSCVIHIKKKQDFFFLEIKHNALANEDCFSLNIYYNYKELEKLIVKTP
jgi:hypothetical protein